MSTPLAVQMIKGLATGGGFGGGISITQDEDDYLPVTFQRWKAHNRYTLNTNANFQITGFDSNGVRELFPVAEGGRTHPFGVKHFICDFNATTFGLLLRHNLTSGGSLSGNRLICPGDLDLLLVNGDGFSMFWSNPFWYIFAVTRRARSIELSPAQITVNQTDYDPPGWRVADKVFIDSDAARTVHSLAADDGVLTSVSWLAHKNQKRIYNEGSFDILFPNESATGTAKYKIRSFSGGDIVLAPNNFVDAYYDVVISRWRMG